MSDVYHDSSFNTYIFPSYANIIVAIALAQKNKKSNWVKIIDVKKELLNMCIIINDEEKEQMKKIINKALKYAEKNAPWFKFDKKNKRVKLK